MIKVVRLKLLPSPEQAGVLAETLRVCNEQAVEVARVAQERRVFGGYDLRAITYGQVRSAGLGAQAAQQVIRKVVDAYKTRRANFRSGRYGPASEPRAQRIMGTAITFRPNAAQPYDDRILSWDHAHQKVSIWTLAGRQRIPFTGHRDHLALVAAHRRGETDLLCDRRGRWFLIATIDQPDPQPAEPEGWIGVDMGIVQIASTATDNATPGTNWSGGAITRRRKKNLRLRRRLQAKGTKSAKRLLKKRSGKEARFATDTNHQVSKKIVAEAKRTGRGIAVEKLTGIRERARHRKPQRATFHSWAFAQLGGFLTYKARAAGVVLVEVDPRHTSQQCHHCGHTSRSNRTSQERFTCTQCGVSLNADTNAAINIARRARDGWGAVNRPHAA